jgi:hypothetical protein
MPHTASRPRAYNRLTPLALVLALLCTGAAHAGVFKCKGPNGTTLFQDSECGPGAQTLAAPKADSGPTVDLTLPFEKRFKTSQERDRVMAALKIAGLELAMRRSIEFCKVRAAGHTRGIEQLFEQWRNERASAITASDQLIERYTSIKERSDGFSEVATMLDQSLNLRVGNDAARNLENCKSAPSKLQSFLSNRHTEAYATVGKPR